MKSKALIVVGKNRIELGEIEIPKPTGDQVLIETAYSCISPGTELRTLAGKQAGFAGFPYIPGYALSGRVVETGPDATLRVGQPVFCSGTAQANHNIMWGAHTAYAVQSETSVFPVAETVPLAEASIAKVAAIAQRGVALARPQGGDNTVVVGLGPIGQLSARLHAVAGARVHATDLSESRVAMLKAAGVPATASGGQPLADLFARIFPEGVHTVVDSTGNPALLMQSLNVGFIKEWNDPRPGAQLVIQGSYPENFSLPYDDAFQRETSIHIPRDQTPAELTHVLDLLAKRQLHVADIVAHVAAPESCQSIYDELARANSELLTAVFRWK